MLLSGIFCTEDPYRKMWYDEIVSYQLDNVLIMILTKTLANAIRPSNWHFSADTITMVVTSLLLTYRSDRFGWAKPSTPKMAALPAARLQTDQPPFSGTGVDYFDLLYVNMKRGTMKRWGCIFTCLVTRAVHIEIAHSMDASTFINALRRFVARRGKPAVIYTDNGTNLTAGERELREALRCWDPESIGRAAELRQIEWRFSPPSAPHFGGVWERVVQSAKRALYAILGDRPTTDETLSTVMAEVEAILNGRPLTHVSVDPRDPEPLTPFHFLLGRSSPSIPPDVFCEGDAVSRKTWRRAQQLVDQFWRRWRREYLPTLQSRKKWTLESRNLQVVDVVLIIDDNAPRGQWPLGRVTEVLPGKNNVVRVARVKTAGGKTYLRPVMKLIVLEIALEQEENSVRTVANGAANVADRDCDRDQQAG